MRLTNYKDYSLRVLIYLGLKKDDELGTIKDIAGFYHISKNHLMKITHELGKLGYIETIRGRNGGIRLAKHPKDINIGEVVSKTEEDFHIVDCFSQGGNYCVISPTCKLKHVLFEALQAFINVLNDYTLEDLIENKDDIYQLLRT
ncbi:Rrf2 family transcriptional regulator [Bacillus sp. S/N-304-OC-R1]|uniref:RrF2 family transcriptional regulator n=1 Tax=Bacillus sp. S/N-304-OC-R1 TaxID=2758034 RepID=UPI001C8D831A|nr:Rrf2 family transcriptional regulator [Bacillus sp. S/N-304-OC-R1]MBY0122876.1 Rrf2 family transcriptional regulator [Bacillus sp. S/N-304-OC-R1]